MMRSLLLLLTATTSSFISSTFTKRSFLTMSTKPSSSLLSCQYNAYLKEGFSYVISCDKIPSAVVVGEEEEEEEGRRRNDNYRILLDDSVLYPEGGGQPCDLGSINDIPIIKVTKPSATSTSTTTTSTSTTTTSTTTSMEGSVEVELPQPLEPGSRVKCVVDWNRRYDFMQQHTAQHLFSAIAYRLYQADTIGWSLSSDSVTVDLTNSKSSSSSLLTQEDINHIEDEVNASIRLGSKVDWKVISSDELSNTDNTELSALRGMVKGAALAMNELRLVSIDGIDLNPCGGTHVQSLAELNLLKVIGIEKDRSALRVRFVAGLRALNYFKNCITREVVVSSKLSAPPNEHVTSIDKLLKERKELSKTLGAYGDELAMFWGQSLVNSLDNNSPVVIVKHREGADLKFLLRAATKAIEMKPNAILLIGGDEGGATTAGKTSSNGPFVLFGDPSIVNKVKEPILSLLGARGGGKPGRLQGFATKIDQINLALDIIQSNL